MLNIDSFTLKQDNSLTFMFNVNIKKLILIQVALIRTVYHFACFCGKSSLLATFLQPVEPSHSILIHCCGKLLPIVFLKSMSHHHQFFSFVIQGLAHSETGVNI